jgi:hypothetical protein
MTEKREAKTRTSITIDKAVLEAVKKFCEDNNMSVSSYLERTSATALGISLPEDPTETV